MISFDEMCDFLREARKDLDAVDDTEFAKVPKLLDKITASIDKAIDKIDDVEREHIHDLADAPRWED